MKFEEMPYKRVDLEEVKQEFTQLMQEFDAAASGEEQFEVHKKYYRFSDHIQTEMTLANIRHDINMEDEFYNAENDYYDEMMPLLQNMMVQYQQKLYNSPYRSYLEEKIGSVAFKNIELAMRAMDEKLIPLMQEENALTPYLRSPDRAVRARAWEKLSGFLRDNEEEIEDIYDKLVKNRTAQAKEKGYDNYLPLGYDRMQRNCYDRGMVEEFRRQVKRDLVPFAEKLHEKRRARIGVDKLSFIDEGVYFKNGNPAPTGNPAEILEAGRQMYRELSPETGEFMDFMCDNNLFDVLGRKNKKTGGYMTYLPDYKRGCDHARMRTCFPGISGRQGSHP